MKYDWESTPEIQQLIDSLIEAMPADFTFIGIGVEHEPTGEGAFIEPEGLEHQEGDVTAADVLKDIMGDTQTAYNKSVLRMRGQEPTPVDLNLPDPNTPLPETRPFTVKIQEFNGGETVLPATCVEAWPIDIGTPSSKPVPPKMIIIFHGNEEPHEVTDGRVFVMNEIGKTVARYTLNEGA